MTTTPGRVVTTIPTIKTHSPTHWLTGPLLIDLILRRLRHEEQKWIPSHEWPGMTECEVVRTCARGVREARNPEFRRDVDDALEIMELCGEIYYGAGHERLKPAPVFDHYS